MRIDFSRPVRHAKAGPDCPQRSRRQRHIGQAGIVAALIATGILLSACGSAPTAGVANIGSSTSTTAPSAGSTSPGSPNTTARDAKALSYAECMRAHGVANFPDPNSQGTFVGQLTGLHLSASSPQYKKANDSCEKLLPGGGQVTPGESQKLEAYALQYATCMRSHGITNFPDPTVMGNGAVSVGQGIDADTVQYRTANQACVSDLHETGAGG